MDSLQPTAGAPTPRPRRRIEYRHFLAGVECTAEEFLEALLAAGGRGQVTAFEITEPAYRPTPEGEAALAGAPEGAR